MPAGDEWETCSQCNGTGKVPIVGTDRKVDCTCTNGKRRRPGNQKTSTAPKRKK